MKKHGTTFYLRKDINLGYMCLSIGVILIILKFLFFRHQIGAIWGVFWISMIAYQLTVGLLFILPNLFLPHILIMQEGIVIRPRGRFRRYKLNWEQIVSISRISKKRSKNDLPFSYEILSEKGKKYTIAALSMAMDDRYELEKVLESKIAKEKWNEKAS